MLFSHEFMHQNMGPLPTRKINSWLKGTETKTRKHTYIDFQMQVGKCLFAPFISLSIIVLLTGMLKSSNLSKNSRAIFHDNIINKLSNANNIFVSLCLTNLNGHFSKNQGLPSPSFTTARQKSVMSFRVVDSSWQINRILKRGGVVIPLIFPNLPRYP